jgi:hypothetical protein
MSKLTKKDKILLLDAIEYFEFALADANFSKDNTLYGFVSFIQFQKNLNRIKKNLTND